MGALQNFLCAATGAYVFRNQREISHVPCFIDDGSLIANRATVLDRARIGRNCLIAAGALIPPDKEIPDGSVVMGSPCANEKLSGPTRTI